MLQVVSTTTTTAKTYQMLGTSALASVDHVVERLAAEAGRLRQIDFGGRERMHWADVVIGYGRHARRDAAVVWPVPRIAEGGGGAGRGQQQAHGAEQSDGRHRPWTCWAHGCGTLLAPRWS